jgi:1,4-alpha-glucan branching enzyme
MVVYARNPEPLGNQRYRFWFRSGDAENVMLAGSFNGFDPFRTRMRRDQNGVWTAVVQVLPGIHHYCFIVDGEWLIDPESKEIAHNRFRQAFSRFRAE